jgi:dimethylargininase
MVIEIPDANDFPDSVFIEDTMVMYKGSVLITRPGNKTREGEVEGLFEFMKNKIGLNNVTVITAPGTLDGGDVLKVGDTIYVGHSGRTNMEGIKQLEKAFSPLGAKIVPVEVKTVLHLKSAISVLPDLTILGWDKEVEDLSLFKTPYKKMPEQSGAHVVLLGNNKILMANDAP